MNGALAAHCADDQGKFWEMAHKIFENYRAYNAETLPQYAAELGLDVDQFQDCFSNEKHKDAINKRKADASRAQVSATPMFLIGYTEDGSTEFKPKDVVRGAYPYATFVQKIDKLLEEKGK